MPRYGFYDRLTSHFPSQLIVDLTEICNLKCIHCPHPQFKLSEHYAGRLLEVALNTKLADEVRTDSDGSCQYIRYTSNGEPLSHPHAHEMIQYAVDHSGTFVTLTTNGTILNERKMEQLLDSGLHMIDISIDALSADTYSKIRGGRLDQVDRNVRRLAQRIQQDKFRTKLVVSFIRQPLNSHEADDFVRYWQDLGIDQVLIRDLHTAAGVLGGEHNEQGQPSDRRPCLYPWERLTLDPRGELGFCPTDWTYSSVFADFRTTTIKQAWQGHFMQQLRAAHMNNDFKCHGFCGQCPDWRLTQWPDNGRSYANLVEDLKVEK
ncbi:MAG: radical SAM protein [Gammaproteobacteria bacterium]|nr:radical SAM protein [Gammaproteobacteria bacterium]